MENRGYRSLQTSQSFAARALIDTVLAQVVTPVAATSANITIIVYVLALLHGVAAIGANPLTRIVAAAIGRHAFVIHANAPRFLARVTFRSAAVGGASAFIAVEPATPLTTATRIKGNAQVVAPLLATRAIAGETFRSLLVRFTLTFGAPSGLISTITAVVFFLNALTIAVFLTRGTRTFPSMFGCAVGHTALVIRAVDCLVRICGRKTATDAIIRNASTQAELSPWLTTIIAVLAVKAILTPFTDGVATDGRRWARTARFFVELAAIADAIAKELRGHAEVVTIELIAVALDFIVLWRRTAVLIVDVVAIANVVAQKIHRYADSVAVEFPSAAGLSCKVGLLVGH